MFSQEGNLLVVNKDFQTTQAHLISKLLCYLKVEISEHLQM